MSDLPIFVISFRRDRLLTIVNLAPPLLGRTKLVVDREDSRRIKSEGLAPPEVQHIISPKQGLGSAIVRQWLLDYCRRLSLPLCIIVDDDLQFLQGRIDRATGRKRFRKATPREQVRAFTDLERRALDTPTAFTSFSDPFFNLRTEKWGLCKYAMCGFFINMEVLHRSRARFDGISNRSDAKFMLETWSAGYPSYNHMHFAVKNTGHSGIGGESLRLANGELVPGARDRGERQTEAHRQLAAKYPRYVKLIERKTKRSDQIGSAVDARIYGLRCYKDNAVKVPS